MGIANPGGSQPAEAKPLAHLVAAASGESPERHFAELGDQVAVDEASPVLSSGRRQRGCRHERLQQDGNRHGAAALEPGSALSDEAPQLGGCLRLGASERSGEPAGLAGHGVGIRRGLQPPYAW